MAIVTNVEIIIPQAMTSFSSPFPDSFLPLQFYPGLNFSTVKDHNLSLELDNPSLLVSHVFI